MKKWTVEATRGDFSAIGEVIGYSWSRAVVEFDDGSTREFEQHEIEEVEIASGIYWRARMAWQDYGRYVYALLAVAIVGIVVINALAERENAKAAEPRQPTELELLTEELNALNVRKVPVLEASRKARIEMEAIETRQKQILEILNSYKTR